MKLRFSGFFFSLFLQLKNTQNCDLFIDFDPIGFKTCLALKNDRQHLNFVKDIYVVGKNNGQKWLYNGQTVLHFEF